MSMNGGSVGSDVSSYGFEDERLDRSVAKMEAKDVKSRVEGVSSLMEILEEGNEEDGGVAGRHAAAVADALIPLTKDNNPKIVCLSCSCIGALATQRGDALRAHPTPIVAALAEALGNNNVRSRKAARGALACLMGSLGGAAVLERLGRAWRHKSSHAREECLGLAIEGLRAGTVTGGSVLGVLLPHVITCLEDSQAAVRKVGVDAIEECAMSVGTAAVSEALRSHTIRPGQLKEINARLKKIGAVSSSSSSSSTTNRNGAATATRERAVGTRSPGRSSPSSEGSPKHGGRAGHSLSRTSSARNGGGGHIDADDCEQPVSLSGERELVREVEAIASKLRGTGEDWNDRIATMKRLEAIVMGDSFNNDAATELLKQLKDPLTAQLLDRRSSIVRQATKLLCTMASQLGPRMEFLVGHTVPTLFKVVVITVQIMADSADSCIRHLLTCCQTHRVLVKICTVITKDRSSKLRAHCLEYLHLVLEAWGAATIERALDVVVDAVRCGLTDADSEARATARRCFATFSQLWPETAHSMMELLDGSLQRILAESSFGNGGGSARASLSVTARPSQRRARDLGRPMSATLQSRGGAAKAEPAKNGSARHARPRSALPSRAAPVARLGSDDDVAAGAIDPTDGVQGAPCDNGPAHVPPVNGFAAPERVALERVSANTLDKPWSQARDGGKQHQGLGTKLGGPAARAPPEPLNTQTSQLSDILSMCSMTELSRAGVDSRWMLKVDMLNDLKNHIIEKEDEMACLPVTDVEKIVEILSSNISHPHAKVASAALDCLAELMPVCMPAMGLFLEVLLPLLFPRLVDAKQVIRELATEVLTAIGSNSSPEMLLPGLLKSLDTVRITKGRIGIVEFSSHYLVTEDVPTVEAEATRAYIRREWMHKLVPFCMDKTAEMRLASIQCIIAVYNNDVEAIIAQVSRLPLDVRETILSALSREVPEFERMLVRDDSASPTDGDAPSSGGTERADERTANSDPSSGTPSGTSGDTDSSGVVVSQLRRDQPSLPRLQQQHRRGHRGDVQRSSKNDDLVGDGDQYGSDRTSGSHTSASPKSATHAANADGMENVAAKKLPLLLANAAMDTSSANRTAILIGIGDLAQTCSNTETWIQYFPRSLMVVMEELGDPTSSSAHGDAFECAACALRNMVVSGPDHFSEYMDLVVPRLLDVNLVPGSPAARLVEEVLQNLFDNVNPGNCVESLLKLPPHDVAAQATHSGPNELTAIKMLNRAVVRFDAEDLKQFVPSLFPGLLAAFSSTSADERKAVVFVLVDMYLLLGNWLQSYLAPLSTSQQKLLTIYINRAVKMENNLTRV